MFIQIKKLKTEYIRVSKNGHKHSYNRVKTLIVMQCDNCQTVFEREQGKMDRRRATPDYYHVCSKCDSKRFAQKRGVERRRIWNLSADSDIDISKL